MFEGNVEKSKELPPFFEGVAKAYGTDYIDAGQYVHSSEEDGLHLTDDQHAILGDVMADKVKEILG